MDCLFAPLSNDSTNINDLESLPDFFVKRLNSHEKIFFSKLIQLYREENSLLQTMILKTDLSDYKREIIKNNSLVTTYSGFNAFDLSLLTCKLDISMFIVKTFSYVFEKIFSNYTVEILKVSELLYNNRELFREEVLPHQSDLSSSLIPYVISNYDTDRVMPHGATLTDDIITQKIYSKQVFEKTHDPLFAFFKPNLNVDNLFADNTIIHIGMNDNSLNENGHMSYRTSDNWNGIRIIMGKHPDVQFHLINREILDQYPDSFNKLDGWYAPGNTSDDLFSKIIIQKTITANMPLYSVCSSNRIFADFHKPLSIPRKDINETDFSSHGKDGESGFHDAFTEFHLQQYSLSYFLTLTKAEKKKALEECAFPAMETILINVRHGDVIDESDLGKDLRIGGLYPEPNGVAAFYHKNGIHFSSWPHPDNYFVDDANPKMQQTLESFLEITRHYHLCEQSKSLCPHEVYPLIEQRLKECSEKPTVFEHQDMLDSYYTGLTVCGLSYQKPNYSDEESWLV
jgi:hypothetical protein